jgi:hypothetical protein
MIETIAFLDLLFVIVSDRRLEYLLTQPYGCALH